jgi:hypothetical protein
MKVRPIRLLLAVTALLAVVLWRGGEGPVRVVAAPDLRPPPAVVEPASRPLRREDETGFGGLGEVRIGSFKRLEDAPDYEILDQSRNERDGARGALLVVDTRSRSEEDFILITRDIKARYADLDALSLRFIDSESVLDYNGGAVIFNTAAGAYFAGYIYGPPNTEGYFVQAAE